AFASALGRKPPEDVEQLVKTTQKYIGEEETNAIKDNTNGENEDEDEVLDGRNELLESLLFRLKRELEMSAVGVSFGSSGGEDVSEEAIEGVAAV
ncbi:UNVERIFIED_CONTAM: hypothetical protein Sindi_0659500, partial [Sesamum indicum]